MTASIGLLGFGLFALACLAFFALLVGALVYVLVFGNPDTKRWKALAAARGWESDGLWRLSGGPQGARWTLRADYDDDRGTGTITWMRDDMPASAPRLLVVRRADYERDRAGSRLAAGGHVAGSMTIEGQRLAFDGLRDAGAGGPRFRQHWVVLAEDASDGRAFLNVQTDAVWLAALDAMPSMFAAADVTFEARAPHARLRAEGARRRPPFDQVERFVRLGLALTDRVNP